MVINPLTRKHKEGWQFEQVRKNCLASLNYHKENTQLP